MKKATNTPLQRCPSCGYRMNAATHVRGEAVPRPGDLSLCWGCGTVLIFDEALRSVLPPTDFELTSDIQAEVTEARRRWNEIRGPMRIPQPKQPELRYERQT